MKQTSLAFAVLCGVFYPWASLTGADAVTTRVTSTSITDTNAKSAVVTAPVAAPSPAISPAPTPTNVETVADASPKDTPKAAADSAKSDASSATTNIQNNSITLGTPSVITVAPATSASTPSLQAAPAAAVAYKGTGEDASSVLSTKEVAKKAYDDRVLLTPMAGISGFTGNWNARVGNSYSFGLGVEIPLTDTFAVEAEGGTGRYNVSYGLPPGAGAPPNTVNAHYFNQYNLGGNLKVYLMKRGIRPFVGAGVMALYYENMNTGFGPNPSYGLGPMSSYNQWMGAGQLIGGADVPLGGGVALGGRAAWILPLFNRPNTEDNGNISMPGYEEAGLMNTSMYKLMGTVSVAF